MTVIGTAVLVKLVNRFYYPPRPFLLWALATATFIDLLLGQSLVFKSILGYCPIKVPGAHAIGNEYMGCYWEWHNWPDRISRGIPCQGKP